MSLVTRYFSTAAAGAGDGTTWADRAALFTAGTWSSVITGFAFNGTDGMIALVGPGSYSSSQSLASALFTNAPSAANPLFLHGCDASGNALAPPSPSWTSDQPAWDDSGLPVIATSAAIVTISLGNCSVRLLKMTASGSNQIIGLVTLIDWCSFINSRASTSAIVSAASRNYNSVYRMTGSSFAAAITASNFSVIFNCRIEGVAGSSGSRAGISYSGDGSGMYVRGVAITGCGGSGILSVATNTGQQFHVSRCTITANGGSAIELTATASQTGTYVVDSCILTGNGAYGINASASHVHAVKNRLRDNVSGNFNGLGNYPSSFDENTGAGTDAAEYVNAAGGDYRIKSGSAIAGMGYGVSDQAASGGGGTSRARVVNGE